MKPSLFYGIAVSAWLGLLLGLALHGPWQSRAGGPQILFASAAAAELARPLTDSDIVQAADSAPEPAYADIAYADIGQIPADPLPVTRLIRMGGAPRPESGLVQEAAVDMPNDDQDRVAVDPDNRRYAAADYAPADDGR